MSESTEAGSGHYVDTSVIIARYKPDDEVYEYAEKLLSRDDVRFYASTLTLVELSAVLSRLLDELIIPQGYEKDLNTLLAFIVKDCKLHFTPHLHTLSVDFHARKIRMPLEYYLAIAHAEKLKLRALDLLHICHAVILGRFHNITSFITGDEELIAQSDMINTMFGLHVKHPRDIIG
ncbi:MAG: PIN domain-containing protein [Nitrososphaerota archaeon]